MAVKGKVAGVQMLRAVLLIGIIAFHCGLPAFEILWGGRSILCYQFLFFD